MFAVVTIENLISSVFRTDFWCKFARTEQKDGFFFRTPDMSKMHHDNSSDLKTIAEVLKRVYEVRDSVPWTIYFLFRFRACHWRRNDLICNLVT